jgi:hypothetical protein
MFSLQASQAVAAMQVDDQTAQALLSLLGDCSQPLEHRAPVTIAGEPTGSPPSMDINNFLTNITNEINNHTNEYYSILHVENQTSTLEGDTIVNNFSIFSPGVSYIQYLTADNITTNDISIIDNGTKYCFVDKEVVTDVESSFDSGTCELTLTVTKETVKVFEACP